MSYSDTSSWYRAFTMSYVIEDTSVPTPMPTGISTKSPTAAPTYRTPPGFASSGTNCNCGNRIYNKAKSTIKACAEECWVNPRCDSFGFWTRSGYCALFDTACPRGNGWDDDTTCRTPTGKPKSPNVLYNRKCSNCAGHWKSSVSGGINIMTQRSGCIVEAITSGSGIKQKTQSLALGMIDGVTVNMFGIAGTLQENTITWGSGDVWTRQTPTFVEGDNGEHECPDDAGALDEAECFSAAIALGYKWGGIGSWERRPTHCLFHRGGDGNANLVFNRHPVGGTHRKRRPVCKQTTFIRKTADGRCSLDGEAPPTGWGSLGRDITLDACRDACLTSSTCNFVGFRRTGKGTSCTEFSVCEAIVAAGRGWETWQKFSGDRRLTSSNETSSEMLHDHVLLVV